MSVKGQLHTCRDVLLIATKKAERFEHQKSVKVLRACLDLVEHMEQTPDKVTHNELDLTLKVLNQALKDVDDKSPVAPALVGAVKNAIGRLEALRPEIPVM
ncbi:MAG TPA: hypothetical protein VKH42_06925 [Vicinamibacterales bacterium]|nr:hypothetical protein [Vicinamibacterales bacterium]